MVHALSKFASSDTHNERIAMDFLLPTGGRMAEEQQQPIVPRRRLTKEMISMIICILVVCLLVALLILGVLIAHYNQAKAPSEKLRRVSFETFSAWALNFDATTPFSEHIHREDLAQTTTEVPYDYDLEEYPYPTPV